MHRNGTGGGIPASGKESMGKVDEELDPVYRLTPWGCLMAVLHDYGVDVSHITGRIGEHMVQDFMQMMVEQGIVERNDEHDS